VLAAGLVGLTAAGSEASASSSTMPSLSQPESTRVMAARLRELAVAGDPFGSPYRFPERILLLRERLAGATDIEQTLQITLMLAHNLLSGGQSAEALAEFEQYERLLKANNRPASSALTIMLLAAKAVCSLRMGEQQNCLVNHNADSCPFPFDAAAHVLSERIDARIAELSAAPSAGAAVDAREIEQYMRRAREGLGMQQSASGLLYLVVQPGAGPRPRHNDRIVLSFTAVAADGKTPLPQLAVQKLRTNISDLLPGLAEGVQLIALGGRAAFVVPPNLSFATGHWPAGVEAGMPIIFRVELEDILPPGEAPATDRSEK